MQHITVDQLKSRIDSGEKLIVIDVREKEEYAEYNINAMLIPLGKILSYQTEELDEYKDREIIVHCRSGNRSMQACMALEMAGFLNVVNVMGGITEWRKKFGDETL